MKLTFEKKLFRIIVALLFAYLFHPQFIYANTQQSVLLGFNVPLTGLYSKQGEDQLRAYKLAVKILNARGGILGRKIIYSVRDTKTDGKVAASNARDLIKSGAVMITGGSSSLSAISQSEVCQENKVVFMAGVTHSNATTGVHGHRHTFRWYNNGHQTAQTMAPLLVEKFGKNARYAFIYADYTWGQTVQASFKEVIENKGGKTVYSRATKLGTKSYISSLLEAKKAKPDVLILVHFGKDMINCLKQITHLKLREEMKIVVPLMELHIAQPLGPEIMQGIITSMPWYHGLSEQYEGSREFVELFESHYGLKPGNSAATAWVNTFQYADAVERAGSFSSKDVIKALEGHRFTLLTDEEYWRSWDHQGIHSTFTAIGKKSEESTGKWDLFKIIAKSNGEEVARTREQNPIQLEPLE